MKMIIVQRLINHKENISITIRDEERERDDRNHTRQSTAWFCKVGSFISKAIIHAQAY